MTHQIKNQSIKSKIARLRFRRLDKVKFMGMIGQVVCIDIAKCLIECKFDKSIYFFNLDGSLNDIIQNDAKLEKIDSITLNH